MINRKEVQHIADLARLSLISKEEEQLQKELSQILDYIDQLKKVDISNVKPTSHPMDIKNVVREDKINKELEHQSEKLLKLVPESKGRYVKVKSIFSS